MAFVKATRKMAKLRLGLTGPSGSGKTYSALLIAKGLGGRTAFIDSERGSASLYSHVTDFDVQELNAPYTPEAYTAAIHEAEQAGYDNIIADSITHEWNGKGGVLELLDNIAKKYKGNSYMAWGELTPRHNKFIDSILQSRCHVIVTMRSKQDFVLVDKGGKQVPQKVGLAPIQREGFEYELTTQLDISIDGNLAIASKDRTGLFRDPQVISEATGQRLMAWLNSGEAAPPPPPPAPAPAASSWTEAHEALAKAIEACTTPPMLSVAWGKAKIACQGEGNRAAYDQLKAVMEKTAENIKAAADADVPV